MFRVILLMISLVFVSSSYAADIAGAEDHPLTGRFEGSEIIKYDYKDFDEYRFIIEPLTSNDKKAHGKHMMRKEGKLTRITYRAPEGASTLGVLRAYEEALTNNDAEIIFQCSGNSGDESCTAKGNGNNFKYASPSGLDTLATKYRVSSF